MSATVATQPLASLSNITSSHGPAFAAPGLQIDHADFEWLRAYLQREEALPTEGAQEEEGNSSETGSTTENESLDGSYHARAPGTPAHMIKQLSSESMHTVVLSRPVSIDELREEDSVDGGFQDSYKRRRKIGWTSTEDLAILATVRRLGTQWHRIAAQFPGRTSDAVRNRWHRLQKTHSLGDSQEGRAALDALLKACGVEQDWLSEQTVSNQASEQVCIKGSDHGRAMWTHEEDNLIEEGVRKHGMKWRQIAASLPGRSDSSVRNRWMRLQKEHADHRPSKTSKSSGSPPVSSPRNQRSDSPLQPLQAVPVVAQAHITLNSTSIGVPSKDIVKKLPRSGSNGGTPALVPLPVSVTSEQTPAPEAQRPPTTLKRGRPGAMTTLGMAASNLVGFDLMSFVEAVSGAIDTSNRHCAASAPTAALVESASYTASPDHDNEPLVFAIDEMASVELYARSERASDCSPSAASCVKRAITPPSPITNIAAILGGLAALTIGFSLIARSR